jgi:hypothetical protein
MSAATQKIVEMHRIAAYAHLAAAEKHGRGDHLSGHEAARIAMDHSSKAFEIALNARRVSEKRARRSSRPGPLAWPSLKSAASTACAIQS